MSIEQTIAQTLGAWPALAGIVIRPDKAEEGDLRPYVTFQKLSGIRVNSLLGDSGLSNTHFQFDVFATTRLQAISVRKEVRLALQASALLGGVHTGEGATFEADTKLFRERVDFSFWFND